MILKELKDLLKGITGLRLVTRKKERNLCSGFVFK